MRSTSAGSGQEPEDCVARPRRLSRGAAAAALLAAALAAPPASGAEPLEPYQGRSLEEWLAAMNDAMAHPDARSEAASAVARIVETAPSDHPDVLAVLPALESAIIDAPVNPEAADGAARALAQIGPGAAPVVPALADLVAIGGEYDPLLTRAQERACTALVAIGVSTQPVWSALEARIRHRGPSYTETEAVMALGRLAPPEVAVPILTETLGFGEPFHVLAAGRALAEIGEPARAALPALLDSVGAGETTWWDGLLAMLGAGPDPRERYFSSGPAAALLVLGRDDVALDLLRYQVTSLEDAFSGRRGAVASLWHARAAGFDRIGPLLVGALDDPSELVRKEALGILERLGPSAEPAFDGVTRLARSDPDDFTRVAALQARWAIADGDVERLLPLLVECTSDEQYRVRGEAAAQIGRMGRAARSARPAVERLLDDADRWVQGRARRALRRLE